jgi:asparagine synthase (glutamine-hydrolysing)
MARPGVFDAHAIASAVASLRHRGPDGSGVHRAYLGAHWECWLGHARLAIVDLSPAGAQPMVREGAGAIVFNGEVYNADELRARAPDWTFRSRSDTEALLARSLEDPRAAMREANAMLAMVVFDTPRRRLVVARDRLGKKPLFVYRSAEVLAFASELKAFAALGLATTLDEVALAHYRYLTYVPAPRTIWRECAKFPAASLAVLDVERESLPELLPELYWDPLGGHGRRFRGTYGDAMEAVDALLADATRRRLQADVPVGIFLSGGIDSSLVAAQVAASNRRDVRAFVVATEDPRSDESPRAVATARSLGLPVEVLRVAREVRARTLESLTWYFDEPHAALSALAIIEMSAALKEHATVVLTGDGGDEAFLGYPWMRYPSLLARPRRWLGAAPGVRSVLDALDRPRLLPLLARSVGFLGLNGSTAHRKLRTLRLALDATSDAAVYELFQAARLRTELTAQDAGRIAPEGFFEETMRLYREYTWSAASSRGAIELAGALDLVRYLRDDVLQKVDRATMASSLEARCPLLDYRLIELAQSLPTEFKVRGRTHKRILRDLAARTIDPQLAMLPKRGFAISSPVDHVPDPTRAWSEWVERDWHHRWLSAGSSAVQVTPSASKSAR